MTSSVTPSRTPLLQVALTLARAGPHTDPDRSRTGKGCYAAFNSL